MGICYCWSTEAYAQMTLGDESLGKFGQSFQRQLVNKNVTCLLRVEFLKCYSVFLFIFNFFIWETGQSVDMHM